MAKKKHSAVTSTGTSLTETELNKMYDSLYVSSPSQQALGMQSVPGGNNYVSNFGISAGGGSGGSIPGQQYNIPAYHPNTYPQSAIGGFTTTTATPNSYWCVDCHPTATPAMYLFRGNSLCLGCFEKRIDKHKRKVKEKAELEQVLGSHL